ncbi:MAG: hypothetical protein ACW99Q_16750, partial [Candidatus Kariarchaeaceae archaeon]
MDEGFSGGFYEVYRSTTQITVSGSYTDSSLAAVPFRGITISMNSSATVDPHNLTSTTTNAQGDFSVVITLPNWTPLEDLTIYARDNLKIIPVEQRVGVGNIRVVTTLDLSDYSRIDPYNGSAVFIGSSVTVSGTIYDDENNYIDSPELSNHLRVIGWNGTHEFGVATIGSPEVGTGNYSLPFAIPLSFSGNSITFRLNVSSSNHYRANYADITVNVYSNIQILDLEIYFPDNGSSITLSNSTSSIVYGIDNRNFNIRGTLRDNFGRILNNKEIQDTWNSTSNRRAGASNAYFDIFYSFPGWNNGSWTWELVHILDEGSLAPTIYTVLLQWEVYDSTNPTITIDSPSPIGTGALANITSTVITATIIDPDNSVGPGYVSVGLNSSSVSISINGTSYSMTPSIGDTFTY